MLGCPRCGKENPDDARFCLQCGASLVEAELREERKIVTVVFADLVGSTARAERLDPEDVRAILAPYHARLRRELERFGGTVEKFIGDAVVGVFGAPTAHEDDPERAVRASLAIQGAIAELNDADPALELEVRVGVNTGEALVALGARPEQGEAMVSGDVMNTGARLQAAAPAGGVLVGEATYRATERVIDYAEERAVAAKGKSQPLQAWLALAPRASYGIDISETGRGRLVGRARELDLLADALTRARETREPQLVTLVGVPGIGKSRLVHELFRIVEEDEELIFWRQGRSLPYGEGVAFWALGEMVKAQAGILESDGAEEAARKLQLAVRDLVADDDQAAWVERHLRALAGVGAREEAAAERGESFAAWRRLIEALCERGPAVFIFEDLHWADDSMLDFVDELVDWVTGVPLLVVATARPELLERRPGWGGGKRNALTSSLSPLSDEDTARLFADLLDRALLPAETQAELLGRAAGNPLFAEEYARMLSAGDGTSVGVPDSLQAIVAARIDDLPTGEKALLHAGSVLGKVFWSDAVGALTGDQREAVVQALRPLERKEFIRRERRSAVAGGEQYAFVHALVRDVAYGQMPRSERSRWHRLAADWIESLPPDRSEDRAEMLAHHFLRALEYDRAAGRVEQPELAARAAAACRAAGDRAWALNAYAAAARHHGSALELGGDDPELLLLIGRALATDAVGGEDELQRSVAGFLALGDPAGAAEAEAELGAFHWRRGFVDLAVEHIERAKVLVADLPPSRARAAVLAAAARLYVLAGRLEEALPLAEEANRIAAELSLVEIRAATMNTVALTKSALHRPDGLEALEAGLAFSLDVSASEAARAYINLGSTTITLGADARRGRSVHEEGLRFAERFGLGWQARWLQAELSIDAYRLGDWDEALRLAEHVIVLAEQTPHYMEVGARYTRGAIRAARGDTDGVRADSVRWVELAREMKDPQTLHPSLACAAYALTLAGDRSTAESLIGELLELLRAGDDPLAETWFVIELALTLAALDGDRSRFEEARRRSPDSRWVIAGGMYLAGEYESAADLLDEIGALNHVAAARVAAAEAHLAAGRRMQADEQLGRALAFYRQVGATALIVEAEKLLPAAS